MPDTVAFDTQDPSIEEERKLKQKIKSLKAQLLHDEIWALDVNEPTFDTHSLPPGARSIDPLTAAQRRRSKAELLLRERIFSETEEFWGTLAERERLCRILTLHARALYPLFAHFEYAIHDSLRTDLWILLNALSTDEQEEQKIQVD